MFYKHLRNWSQARLSSASRKEDKKCDLCGGHRIVGIELGCGKGRICWTCTVTSSHEVCLCQETVESFYSHLIIDEEMAVYLERISYLDYSDRVLLSERIKENLILDDYSDSDKVFPPLKRVAWGVTKMIEIPNENKGKKVNRKRRSS